MISLYRTFCGYLCGNSGDLSTEILIEKLFGLRVHAHEDPLQFSSTHIIGAGSVAEKIPYGYTGFIWGSGVMFENSRPDTPEATVIAVRGHLTKRRWLGHQADNAMVGDIGLLVDRIFDKSNITKRYVVGLLPHYIDRENMEVREFLRKNPETTSIDICGRLDDVLRAICECEFIMSSSLHGLIFADALNTPNHWMYLSDRISGGSFKYKDYYSIFNDYDPLPCLFNSGMSITDLQWYVRNYQQERPRIDKIKYDLEKSFPREQLLEMINEDND
jgi:hypothetical protein